MESIELIKNNYKERIKDIVGKCISNSKGEYDVSTVNVYIIDESENGKVLSITKIKRLNDIPFLKLYDLDKGQGSIIVLFKDTVFTNLKIALRKFCITFIEKSKHKIQNLSILNHNGFGSLLYINKNFSCNGAELRLWEFKNIFIGNDVMFTWGIRLFTSDGHLIFDNEKNVINPPGDIVIGDHVWIGHDVKILKGVFLNSNNIVGAGSLISKPIIDTNVILSGVPAVIKKSGVLWSRNHIEPKNYKVFLQEILSLR